MAANFMVRKPIPTRRRLPDADGRNNNASEGDTANIATKKVGDVQWDDFDEIVRQGLMQKAMLYRN